MDGYLSTLVRMEESDDLRLELESCSSKEPFLVLESSNHIFYESLSSSDDNDRDKYLQKDKYKDKDTHTQTKTNTKCFQGPMYAIFIKSRGFKDLKYYIGCLLVMTQTKTKTQSYALLGVNIFKG